MIGIHGVRVYKSLLNMNRILNFVFKGGDHGGDNEKSSMHPLFVATGPAFKKNHTANTFNNTDIYILMCTILGLQPAQHNGSYDNIKDLLIDGYSPTTSANKVQNDDLKIVIINFKSYAYNIHLVDVLLIIFLVIVLYSIKSFYSNKKRNLSIRSEPIKKNIDF
jgi:hypothetical protein